MSKPWDKQPVFCLTADVDWASETAIASCQALFDEFKVKPTYFATHPSPLLNSLLAKNRIELGIHPNFLSGSSQGEGFTAVLDYLAQAVPGAVCFRSHRYFDVTDTNVQLANRGFLYDSNLFSFLHKLPPHKHFSGMVRFPCCWEDGTWLKNGGSLDISDFCDQLFAPGLTVLSVHPMHMALNSPDLDYARSVKDRLTREQWNAMDALALEKTAHTGRGIRDFTVDMVREILKQGHRFHTLADLYDLYCETA